MANKLAGLDKEKKQRGQRAERAALKNRTELNRTQLTKLANLERTTTVQKLPLKIVGQRQR